MRKPTRITVLRTDDQWQAIARDGAEEVVGWFHPTPEAAITEAFELFDVDQERRHAGLQESKPNPDDDLFGDLL